MSPVHRTSTAVRQPWLALKIPPLALVALAAAVIGWLPEAWRLPLPPPWRLALGGLGVLAGALVCLAGVLAFRRARTTVDPLHPQAASALLVRGIYRHSRNPMYLGFALALLGWGLWLAQPGALAVLALFVAWLDRYQIAPEEAALRQRFGGDFDAYAAQVPRWLGLPFRSRSAGRC